MRCDDPKCSCQPAPKKPAIPPPVHMYIRGPEPGQFRALHQPESNLDIIFEFDNHLMCVKDTIVDHSRKYTFTSTYIQLGVHNARFINLQGLEDNSLLLTIKLRSSAYVDRKKGMRCREKVSGFVQQTEIKSRLLDDLYHCDWVEPVIQVVIPEHRTMGWKTVALILLTFQRVTLENWCCLVNMTDCPPMAGLDWREIESEVQYESDDKPTKKPIVRKMDIEGDALLYSNPALNWI